MADDPQYWRAYAQIQEKLANAPAVDGYAWGLEACLDRLLVSIGQQLVSEEELNRAVRSESRRERHRAELRSTRSVPEVCSEPEPALDARRRLRAVEALVDESDWALLLAVGEGQDFGEIANARSVTPGSLRIRVMRLRRVLCSQHGGSVGERRERAA